MCRGLSTGVDGTGVVDRGVAELELELDVAGGSSGEAVAAPAAADDEL